MPSAKVTRAIRAFEKAVEDKAFVGTIPLHSDDEEEQKEADIMRAVIQNNYIKARAKLERLMENV